MNEVRNEIRQTEERLSVKKKKIIFKKKETSNIIFVRGK